jgi:hypothetical protein
MGGEANKRAKKSTQMEVFWIPYFSLKLSLIKFFFKL